MNKAALYTAGALLALAAAPVLGQAGGGAAAPPSNGGSAAGGGAADRLAAPSADPSNAQQALDRQGEFGRYRGRGGAKRAQVYFDQIQQFQTESAGRRTEALAMRETALAGGTVPMTAGEIRTALEQDMEDWRTTFKIGSEQYQGLHDTIMVDESALNARQWADRRAQWFELRDEWLAQQIAGVEGAGAGG
jgi:hypothetical protein